MVEFSLGPCRVQLHFLFLAAIGIVLFTDARNTALLGICSVAIHEGGHLLMMLLCGIPPRAVVIQPFGVLIYQRENHRRSYFRDALVSLGGPLSNALVAGAFLLFRSGLTMSSAFLWTNLALGLFNLLPVESLDGGRALASVLTPYRTARTVSRVVTVTSLCCLLPMATLGFWLLLISRWNVSLLLASVYLMFCLVLKERSPVY